MSDLKLNTPLTLRCGLTLPNRLVNPAMAESFADKDSLPTSKACISAYERWAEGGWGMIMTGQYTHRIVHRFLHRTETAKAMSKSTSLT